MNCHDYAAMLMEGPPPPAEALAHARECPQCRALADLHASARTLRLAEPPTPAAIAYPAILGEVRRRQRRRRSVAAVGASAALVLLGVWFSPRAPLPMSAEDTSPGGVALEGSARVVQPSSGGVSTSDTSSRDASSRGTRQGLASLGELLAEVDGYTRTTPGVEDAMYRPFGALPSWVHASESETLDTEPFRTALAAFAVSRSPRVVE